MDIFVTGGAGYIGTHVLTELIAQGHRPCVYDNFSNSKPVALERVRSLTNADFEVVEGDIRDTAALRSAVSVFRPDVVIHMAGLKAVGDSVQRPLPYYDINVNGTIALLAAMEEAGCERIVFSSSASIYGRPQYLPVDEAHLLAPANPYGRTKMFVENIIRDWTATQHERSAVLLRYFNPVGAHASGLIGEDPHDVPNNLMPYISQVAVGQQTELTVFGDDFETRDGTGERDYIHVMDLASAHLAALNYCLENHGCEAINVGTGTGVTVLELVRAFAAASGRPVTYRVVGRRSGDVASSVADASRAHDLLQWRAKYNLYDMCSSAWAWQSRNPNGRGNR